jgi:hypothetical protein
MFVFNQKYAFVYTNHFVFIIIILNYTNSLIEYQIEHGVGRLQ